MSDTLKIVALGLIAFAFGTAGGVLFGKLLCKVLTWKDQPADRFSRCFCRSYGSPCIPEGWCGGRSDELPADACDGTERSRCYRYSVAAGTFMAIFGV